MFTGPVGPVEVFFCRPEVIFGNFYWPGAIGPLLAPSSPAQAFDLLKNSVHTNKAIISAHDRH